MSVARAQREIDSVEFGEWMADYNIEAWDERDDERAALICREVVNNRGFVSPPTVAAKLSDFMRKKKTAPHGIQPVQEMRANWNQAVAAFEKQRIAQEKKQKQRPERRKQRP